MSFRKGPVSPSRSFGTSNAPPSPRPNTTIRQVCFFHIGLPLIAVFLAVSLGLSYVIAVAITLVMIGLLGLVLFRPEEDARQAFWLGMMLLGLVLGVLFGGRT